MRLRAEKTVAGVAKTGNDVAAFVEVVVYGGSEDRQVGIKTVDVANSLRSSDEVDEADARGVALL